MSKTITITPHDIFLNRKLTFQIPEIIEQIVGRKIIKDYAAEMGITIETEELQKAADEFRLEKKLQNADETWKWLENYGLSVDDFEELIYINLLGNKIIDHLFADKIEPYFFAHKLDYSSVFMYELVLEDEDLALELFYSIKEGELSFFDVAHQHIKEIELRRKCGYLGKVNRQQLKPEISAKVFAANPPQVLKPIITAKGVHLILVEEIIHPELDLNLRRQITTDLFDNWLKEQIAQIEVIKKWDLPMD